MKGPSIIPTFTDDELAHQTWTPYAKFPNYGISRLGNPCHFVTIDGKLTAKPLKIYYPTTAKANPYAGIGINHNGRTVKVNIHRMVAETFLPVPSADHKHVNHIDGNKWNNRASNLEWLTTRDHGAHTSRMGLIASGDDHYTRRHPELCHRGERHHLSTITEATANEIRSRLAANPKVNCRAMAREFGISPNVIYHIKYGESWKHLR